MEQGKEMAKKMLPHVHNAIFLKILFVLFLERGKETEREGETHRCVGASRTPPTGDLAHNPACALDWELNQRPFDSRASTQPLSHTSQGHNAIFNQVMRKASVWM